MSMISHCNAGVAGCVVTVVVAEELTDDDAVVETVLDALDV